MADAIEDQFLQADACMFAFDACLRAILCSWHNGTRRL